MKTKSPEPTIGTEALARLLAKNETPLTATRLRQLVTAGILPAPQRNCWPLVAVLLGLVRHYRQGNRTTHEALLQARLESARLENERREIALKQTLGEWISLKTVDGVWQYMSAGIAAEIKAAELPEPVKVRLLTSCAKSIPLSHELYKRHEIKTTPPPAQT